MKFLTPEILAAHLRLDSDASPEEMALVEVYGNAAESRCEKYLNRRVCVDEAEAESIALEADEFLSGYAEPMGIKLRTSIENDLHAIAINENIRAAMLLVAGHLYRNREENVTGQGEVAQPLPMGVEYLLHDDRWLGPL